MGTDDLRLARSFGSAAARYEQYRPSYPTAAIETVLAGVSQPRTILDLGAGTGKLTRSLIGRADEIIAIEPDEQMRAELRSQLPTVTAPEGSAEQTGLADHSVDAVFVGQAFHWFARPAADAELARIIRPGGVAGLVWNLPDLSVPWVAELYDVLDDASRSWGETTDQPLHEQWFTAPERRRFDWAHELPGSDGLLGLVHTWSSVLIRSPEDQDDLDRRIRDLIAKTPALQGEFLSMPHQTEVLVQYRR